MREGPSAIPAPGALAVPNAVTRPHAAAENGHYHVIAALVRASADPTATDLLERRDARGCTPLHLAVLKDSAAAVAACLDAGADPNAPVCTAAAPWVDGHDDASAAAPRQRRLARALPPDRPLAPSPSARIEPEATPPRRSPPLNSTPLHLAASPSVVKLLIDAGARVNEPCHRGHTPLMAAALRGLPAVCAALARAHASLDAVDGLGMTAAHFAVSAGSVDALRQLIAAGADVNVLAAGGVTALDIAAKTQSRALTSVLLEGGAVPDRVLLSRVSRDALAAPLQVLGALGACKLCYLRLRGLLPGRLCVACWCGGDIARFKLRLDRTRKIAFFRAKVRPTDFTPALRWGALDRSCLESILLRAGVSVPRAPAPLVDPLCASPLAAGVAALTTPGARPTVAAG